MLSDLWCGSVIINMLTDVFTVEVLKIGSLTDVLVHVSVDKLVEVEIIVEVRVAIAVECFAVDVLSGVVIVVFMEALSDMLTVVIIAVAITIDVLADVNASVLADVMTTFEFDMPVP